MTSLVTWTNQSNRRRVWRWIAAVLFVAAGINHFVMPKTYEKVVPPQLPSPAAMVVISGIAEIAGGVGLLILPLRVAAGWGLVALLIAVFPANIYMAVATEPIGVHLPRWVLWARLPMQFLLIWWVWVVSRPEAVLKT